MTDSLTARLADFIADTSRKDFPDGIEDAAVRLVIDTIGVILAGRSGGAGAKILHYAEQACGSVGGPTNWLGIPVSAPPELVALASSTLGHALDFDDELAGTGHPASILASAILAMPTRPLTGEKLIEAFVIGYEANVRVAHLVGHRHYRKGWHTTSTIGGFGAVAATSKLLGLDAAQIRTALGIAGSLASGIQRNFGTETKPLHSGLSARNGVLATQLAAASFTAAPNILDGPRGFTEIYADGGDHQDALDDLGQSWALLAPGATLKKYPCCYATHRPIDAVLRLRAEHNLKPSDVVAVIDRAPTFGLTPLIHHDPKTGLQGKFSLEYVVAAALLDGQITLGSFTDDMVNRPEIRALLPLLDAKEDPRCRPEDPTAKDSSAGTGGFHEVTIRTTDGRELSTRVDYPSGSPKHPLSWDDSRAKFRDCVLAAGRNEERGMALFDALRGLPSLTDVHATLDSATA
ncbi:MmgE/PrpD family protein [Micromonospora cremea]|uniref:2-methylcitrate dehydratase PrpD n=1 Tax=Micromonospora cremea TaxID=709881 RepID=A0A1N5VJ23_9ACTN|nr:MmgE/PrpD family protein [Micromonospora cremea]SIM72696.1 2-methylcitrate dehydratase PrpD [Micromonospora cremea]